MQHFIITHIHNLTYGHYHNKQCQLANTYLHNILTLYRIALYNLPGYVISYNHMQ